jgi:branched-chain amino acid transport system permease protein
MSQFLGVLVAGILVGSLYGLFSSGLTLIFGITRIINFAHGDFVTVGMYAAIVLSTSYGIAPLYMALPIALVMMIAGMLLYRTILYRTVAKSSLSAHEAQGSQMVLTLALSIIVVNGLLAIFGPNARTAEPTLTHVYHVGGIYVPETRLVSFALSIVIFIVLKLVISRTRFGRAVRATVDDREMATMLGVNTERVYTIAFGIGVLLAGLTGAILASYYTATPATGENFLILGFVTVVLGGLGNIQGAFFAGIVIGVAEQLTATYVALDLQDVGIFAVFIAALLVRSSGTLSRAFSGRFAS